MAARNRGIDKQRGMARRPEQPTSLPVADHGITGRDTVPHVPDRSATDWALRLIASLPPDQAAVMLILSVAQQISGQPKSYDEVYYLHK